MKRAIAVSLIDVIPGKESLRFLEWSYHAMKRAIAVSLIDVIPGKNYCGFWTDHTIL